MRPNVALGASHAPNATLGASHAPNATLGRLPATRTKHDQPSQDTTNQTAPTHTTAGGTHTPPHPDTKPKTRAERLVKVLFPALTSLSARSHTRASGCPNATLFSAEGRPLTNIIPRNRTIFNEPSPINPHQLILTQRTAMNPRLPTLTRSNNQRITPSMQLILGRPRGNRQHPQPMPPQLMHLSQLPMRSRRSRRDSRPPLNRLRRCISRENPVLGKSLRPLISTSLVKQLHLPRVVLLNLLIQLARHSHACSSARES